MISLASSSLSLSRATVERGVIVSIMPCDFALWVMVNLRRQSRESNLVAKNSVMNLREAFDTNNLSILLKFKSVIGEEGLKIAN